MKKTLIIFSLIILTGGLTMALFGNNSREDSRTPSARLEKATFAGGCFWCMQPPYDKLTGVVSTTAGYTGSR